MSSSWLSGWQYRIAITVTNNNSSQLDYQIEVVLPGTFPYNYVYYDDGRDIRITDAKNNVLPYWIEKFDKTNKVGIIWFRATLPPNSTTKFYMYFGNPNAANAQNPSGVFLTFDHFDGTSTKFKIDGSATVSISNSVATITITTNEFGSGVFFIAPAPSDVKVISSIASADKYLFIGNAAYRDQDNWYALIIKGAYNTISLEKKENGIFNSDATASFTFSPNTYYRIKFIKTGSKYNGTVDGTYISYNITTVNTNYAGTFFAYHGATKPVAYVDYIAIANAVDNEPTVSIGSVESILSENITNASSDTLSTYQVNVSYDVEGVGAITSDALSVYQVNASYNIERVGTVTSDALSVYQMSASYGVERVGTVTSDTLSTYKVNVSYNYNVEIVGTVVSDVLSVYQIGVSSNVESVANIVSDVFAVSTITVSVQQPVVQAGGVVSLPWWLLLLLLLILLLGRRRKRHQE